MTLVLVQCVRCNAAAAHISQERPLLTDKLCALRTLWYDVYIANILRVESNIHILWSNSVEKKIIPWKQFFFSGKKKCY